MNNVFLITSCTDRNRGAVVPDLRVRSLKGGSADARADQWIQRLEAAGPAARTALDTYVGEHWFVARKAAPLATRLLVISAGYGLVDADDFVHPYSATFAKDHADSVGESLEHQTTWWRRLSEWSGPTPRRTSLLELSDLGVVIIAASANYLVALTHEISLLDPERVLVLSTGSRPSLLSQYRLTVTGRVRTTLGGSMMSTNIRVAQRLLQEFGGTIDRRSAGAFLADLEDGSEPLPVFQRTPLDDEAAVCREIDRYLAGPGPHTPTGGLHWLRTEGFACEQTKFSSIFRSHVTGDSPS